MVAPAVRKAVVIAFTFKTMPFTAATSTPSGLVTKNFYISMTRTAVRAGSGASRRRAMAAADSGISILCILPPSRAAARSVSGFDPGESSPSSCYCFRGHSTGNSGSSNSHPEAPSGIPPWNTSELHVVSTEAGDT